MVLHRGLELLLPLFLLSVDELIQGRLLNLLQDRNNDRWQVSDWADSNKGTQRGVMDFT